MKVGFTGVYITRTCFPDGLKKKSHEQNCFGGFIEVSYYDVNKQANILSISQTLLRTNGYSEEFATQ